MVSKKERDTNVVVYAPYGNYAPYITVRKFQEITGLSIRTIQRKIKSGELLTVKSEGEKGLVMINMYEYALQAAKQAKNIIDIADEAADDE